MEAVIACGSKKPPASLLQGLVGLPVSTLGNLASNVATKKVNDIVEGLSSPAWVASVDR